MQGFTSVFTTVLILTVTVLTTVMIPTVTVSDTDDHVMSSARFYPRTYDSDDTDGHSNSDTDDHVMSSVRFHFRTNDSDDTDAALMIT